MAQKQNPFQKRREVQLIEEISEAGKGQEENIEEKIEEMIEEKAGVKQEQNAGPVIEEKIEEKKESAELPEFEEKEEEEEGEKEAGDLSFLQSVMQKPKKEESKGKNLYLSMDNIKAIEKLSKKAGKSHSQFVDDLLTEVFKVMK